jgi:phosphoglycolate phosphatase
MDNTMVSAIPHTKWTCVLFDLDGTIADSAKGITESLAATLTELGLQVPPVEELRSWVGPPPAESFRYRLGLDAAAAEHARQIYRKHYEQIGNADIRPFEAIPRVLEALSRAGMPTAVATSKPEHTATEVLERLSLARYFTAIAGASKDETISAKAAIVGEALHRLQARGIDISNPVMVGDRVHDIVGAAEHGIPTVLVDWGYAQKWEHAQAIATVDSATALENILLRAEAGSWPA